MCYGPKFSQIFWYAWVLVKGQRHDGMVFPSKVRLWLWAGWQATCSPVKGGDTPGAIGKGSPAKTVEGAAARGG